jgi:hypothetical protein
MSARVAALAILAVATAPLTLIVGSAASSAVLVAVAIADTVSEAERCRAGRRSRAATRIGVSRYVVARRLIEDGGVTIRRAVPNISSDLPAETRDFFVGLLGFEEAMDMGWIVTVTSPTNPAVQVSIIGNDDPSAPGISVEVEDVDAVHARAVEQGFEISYSLRDEEWGVRRFMLREPGGTTVNVLSHRPG